jgi:hypothetical protein
VLASVIIVAGISLLGLAVVDFYRRRDAKSLLLLLWVLGTFVFAAFINWSVNGRSILPMIPAVGILLMRGLEAQGPAGAKRPDRWVALPLLPALLVALAVTWADTTLANSARKAAETIERTYQRHPGKTWFQGHWGFQYYMERGGGLPVDFRESRIGTGDLIVLPSNNTNVEPLPENMVIQREALRFPLFPAMAVMSKHEDAGFYSSVWGPVPFLVGSVKPEEYVVYSPR